MIKDYISKILQDSLSEIGISKKEVQFDKPKEEKFGDLSTNIAMLLAKELKQPPRKIAEEIISKIDYEKDLISKIEIAGAGFINFFISDDYYKKELLKFFKKNLISENRTYTKERQRILSG